MSNLIQITDFTNRFSENLMPVGATFTDANQTKNITSGTGAITTGFADNTDYAFEVVNTSFTTVDLNFNFGNTLRTPIGGREGYFIFQMSIKDAVGGVNSFLPFDFEVLIFKDNVHTDSMFGTFDVDSAEFDDKWVTFAQNIFVSGLVGNVDFAFKIINDPTSPASTANWYFGQMKFEQDNKSLGIPTPFTIPKDFLIKENSLFISETQWDVADVGPQVVANGGFINLFSLINNATDKNVVNSDTYDPLNIVSNSIITDYKGCKTIHLIRVSFNVIAGTDQFYQLQIRRTLDDSVVYRSQLQRNADETIQTVEMTTRTLSNTDPFTIDGFYIAFVNNSGASATIDDSLSVVIISNYQKAQKQ